MSDGNQPADLPLPEDAIVVALIAAFPKMYRTPDPADESTLIVFTADDGGSAMRALTFGEIAKALAGTFTNARAQGAAAERERIMSLAARAICYGADGQPCGASVADILAYVLAGDAP